MERTFYPVVFTQNYFILCFYQGPEMTVPRNRLPRSKGDPRPPRRSLPRSGPTTDFVTSVRSSTPEQKEKARKLEEFFNEEVPVHEAPSHLHTPNPSSNQEKRVVLSSHLRLVRRGFEEISESLTCL